MIALRRLKSLVELVPVLAGALLFYAGIAKLADLAGPYSMLMMIMVSAELLLGTTLVLGFFEKWAVALAITLFAVFCIYHVLTENEVCACLGNQGMRSDLLLLVDIAITAGLALRMHFIESDRFRDRFLALRLGVLVTAAFLVFHNSIEQIGEAQGGYTILKF